jgi:ParB/Sulfiredoxin domain
MHVRDRIRELRRVKASQLRPNPRNWRSHPAAQRDALRGVLAEVGYADALVAWEADDGQLELIDGHLRAETTPDMEVPVLVLDVTADEAAKLLTLLDPLCGMAQTNGDRLSQLLSQVDTQSAAVRAVLDQLAQSAAERSLPIPDETAASPLLRSSYQVVVDCRNEDEQRRTYERLIGEGFACRLLMI